jgi:hypothetical protein
MSTVAGTAKSRHVFLSYAHADRLVAERVAAALRDAGLDPWFDAWDLQPGDSIADRVNTALASSDVFLVLLSPNSVSSHWIQAELNSALASELKNRGISVVPALIEDCDVPAVLADRSMVDMRDDLDGGIGKLASQLAAARNIDFSKLTGAQFESLVLDLLSSLGFRLQEPLFSSDIGFDLVASYRSPDPFGEMRTETWLVETKLYKEQRLSVEGVRHLAGQLWSLPNIHKALVITNSGTTSVAREFIGQLTRERGLGFEIRIVDGEELVRLLMQHPGLVDRYFPAGSDGV